MKKRILALVLALALIGSMIPVSVTAEPAHGTSHACDCCNTTVTWTAWGDDAAEKNTMPSAAGHYYLTQDISVSAMVNLSAKVTICLNGKTVTAPSSARVYFVKPGATLSITDCTAKTVNGTYTAGKFTGGTVAWGSIFSVDYRGTLNWYEGILTGNSNTASSGGIGAIYLRAGNASNAGSRMNLYGGEISGNNSKNGVIYMAGTGSSFYMYGGEIKNNTATDKGGAIYATGGSIISLEGGKITANSAKNGGGGIYVNNAADQISVSKKAYISGNLKGTAPSNLFLNSSVLLNVSNLETGANIGISTTARAFSTATDKDYASFFSSDDSTMGVTTVGGKLTLATGHLHKVCLDAACTDHNASLWTAWGDDAAEKTTLPSTAGHYYLTQDIAVSAMVNLSANVSICLNGKTVTAPSGARVYFIKPGATLNVTDCTAQTVDGTYTAGKFTGGTVAWGSIFSVDYRGTLNWYEGILTGNSNTASSGGIGAIYLRAGSGSNAGSRMNMYGGEISGNSSKNGVIYMAGTTSSFYMYGGEIKNNTATDKGGAIYATGGSIISLEGGKITANSAKNGGGGIYVNNAADQISVSKKAYISGNLKGTAPSNLYLNSAVLLNVSNLETGASIGISTTARAFSFDTDKDYAGFFTSDDPALTVSTVSGKLTMVTSHLHKVCADSTCTEHTNQLWTAWGDDAAEKTTLPTEAGCYCLTQDITLDAMVNLNENVSICLNGKTVTAPSGARVYFIKPGATLNVTDCTAQTVDGTYTAGKFTGGSVAWGSIFSVDYRGTLNWYEGILTGNSNTASSGGIGAIYLRAGNASNAGSRMNMYGGEISGNSSKNGAIYMAGTTSAFYMYGGEIKNNTATDKGGAIYTTGGSIVSLEGGKITANSAKNGGGGIYVNNAADRISVSKTAYISGNLADSAPSNLYLNNSVLLNVSNLETGASIGISTSARAFSAATDKDYTGFFTSDASTLTVRTTNNQLTLVSNHQHNVCADASCTEHSTIGWAPWNSTGSLPTEGTYYLTDNVVLTGKQTELSGDLKLCLNGFTITAAESARIFFIKPGTTLSITDCQDTGTLTGGTVAWGSILSIDCGGTVNLYKGTISGNGSEAASGGIGAIYLRPGTNQRNGAVLNIYGGHFTNNTCAQGVIYLAGGVAETTPTTLNIYGGQFDYNTSSGNGGVVYATGGAIVNLLGGTLENNSAANTGGAIYMGTKTTLTVGTCTVQNNTASKAGGIFCNSDMVKIALSGSPKIQANLAGQKAGNLHLGGTQVLEAKNLTVNAKVGISVDKVFRTVSGTIDQTLTGCFTSDRSTFFIEYQEGKLYLGAAAGHDHCLCNGTTDKCDHTVLTWAPWEDPTTLPTEGTYYLTVDVVMTNTVETSGDLQLCLNGHTVTAPEGKRHMNITKNCFFELTDCAEKPGKFTGGTQTYGASISIRTAGAMSLYGGKFSGNSNESEGGAIYLQAAQKFGTTEYAGAKFYMYGGEISGNTALIGGGISVGATSSQYFNDQTYDGSLEDPVLHIYGGKIVNNVSTGNGGGIYTRAYSDSQILGGIISGNTAKLSGGGVYANGQCDLQLIGGVIEKNSAGKYGGGVHGTVDAVIHLSGTPIRNNTAKESGGGVGLSGGAQLLMTGGTISGNTSANGGGVISMSKAVITLKGGSITGNTASKNAGGIYVSTNTFFHMYGGSISYNKATGHAGGIYFFKSSGYLYGGSLTGNEGTNGGALYTNSAVTFQMYGGSIYGNTARTSAGGIYLFKTPAKLTGGTIYKNNAGTSGGAILLGGKATTLVENVKFYDNQANGAGAIIVQGSAIMEMKDCQITDNLARTGHGGGLYVSNSSDVNITNTLFSGNEANNGGAYYAPIKSNGTLNNCLLENNVARAVGGAVYTRGNLNINGSTIRNNIADKNGGAIATWKNGSQNLGFQPGLLVSDTLIENNTAGARGGGLYLELGNNAQLTNVTITGNSAGDVGGALYAIDDLYMHGITVTGNTSGGDGYAVYLDDNRYDGHSYTTGLLKMCGDIIVRDNQGGDLYLGATATIAACAEDFGPKTYIDLTLDSGVLTNRIFGTYDYEGGDCHYILTYGTRSIDDPEPVPTDSTETADTAQNTTQGSTDILLYAGVGVVALATIAAVILVLKKKKSAKADKT